MNKPKKKKKKSSLEKEKCTIIEGQEKKNARGEKLRISKKKKKEQILKILLQLKYDVPYSFKKIISR